MFLNNQQVLNRFREHRSGTGGNMSTDGNLLYSYSAVIAQHLHAEDNLMSQEAVAIINGDRLSKTTSRHISMFRWSEPIVSFSALSGARLTRGGSGLNQGPIREGVQLVDFENSLYVNIYEDEPGYDTVLKNVPPGATSFEATGNNYTVEESYCHYGYAELNAGQSCNPSRCWGCPDRRSRFVAKRNRGYRGYHRAGAVVLRYEGYDYLCGFDEGSYFVSKLPMKVKTVEGAFQVLMPKGINGQKYLRQGEWFFTEAPQDVLDNLALQGEKHMGLKFTITGFKRIAERKAPPFAPGGNPHSVTYLYNDGIFLLAAGTVRHPQHRMLKLEPGKVYIVHRNTSLGDWSAAGRVD